MRQALKIQRDLATKSPDLLETFRRVFLRNGGSKMRDLNLHRQQREPLADIVMQFSRDSTALPLLGLNQLTAHLFERLLGELLVRHINSRRNKTGKRSISIDSRRSNVDYPAVRSVVAPQPIFRRKRLSILQRL